MTWFGRCERCARPGTLYVSHIEPKGRVRALEFDTDNAFAFCYYCHIHWWHKHPREAQQFTEERLGHEAAKLLELRARTLRASDVDWAAKVVALRLEVRRITQGG